MKDFALEEKYNLAMKELGLMFMKLKKLESERDLWFDCYNNLFKEKLEKETKSQELSSEPI